MCIRDRLYHDPTVLDIKRDFINTQFRSQPVTLEQCLGHSWIRRLFRSILRVLALSLIHI